MHEIRSRLQAGGPRVALAAKKSAGRRGGDGAGPSLAALSIRREEARRTDQRREDRLLNVVEQATITHRRRRHEVPIVNVSSQGALIESDIEARIGDRIDITFAGCNPTACHVRWIKGRRIGLEFSEGTVIIAPKDVRELVVGGRRAGERPVPISVKTNRPRRERLIWRGTLHWPDGSAPVRLRNISTEGAMLDAERALAPGTAATLELAGAGAAAGEVRWSRSGQIGLRFDAPFDLASLARPEAASESPAMVRPDYLKSEESPDSPWAGKRTGLTLDDL